MKDFTHLPSSGYPQGDATVRVLRRYSSGKEEKMLRSKIIGYSSYKSALEASSSKRIETVTKESYKV